jgi:hypothetical protein
MRASARHGLIITGWELRQLLHEKAIMIMAGLFTFALPAYLGATCTPSSMASGLYFSALESAFAPIFVASMMMVQSFIADRDRGILPTLLATPISNLALFTGKALPIIVLGLFQGACGLSMFAFMVWLKHPGMLAEANRFAVSLIPLLVICTTLVVCGLGIIVVSRTRSPRSASLLLTFSSLGVLMCEFLIGLFLMFDRTGHRLAPDAILTQAALGIALLVVAANTYQRERIIARL